LESAINTFVDGERHRLFDGDTDLAYPPDLTRFLNFLGATVHAGIAYCAAVAAAALEHANLPGFNENWLELSAKAGATDFAFITRKGQGQPVPYAKSARCRLFIAVGETMHQACPCRRKDRHGAARRGRLN
jgi:hypothetical protein